MEKLGHNCQNFLYFLYLNSIYCPLKYFMFYMKIKHVEKVNKGLFLELKSGRKFKQGISGLVTASKRGRIHLNHCASAGSKGSVRTTAGKAKPLMQSMVSLDREGL